MHNTSLIIIRLAINLLAEGTPALMRTEYAEIDHQPDTWHVSKGFSKKLVAGATNEVR